MTPVVFRTRNQASSSMTIWTRMYPGNSLRRWELRSPLLRMISSLGGHFHPSDAVIHAEAVPAQVQVALDHVLLARIGMDYVPAQVSGRLHCGHCLAPG